MAKISITIECERHETAQALPLLAMLLDEGESASLDLSNELMPASLLYIIRQLNGQIKPMRGGGMHSIERDQDKRQLWQTLFEHMQFLQSDFDQTMRAIAQARGNRGQGDQAG